MTDAERQRRYRERRDARAGVAPLTTELAELRAEADRLRAEIVARRAHPEIGELRAEIDRLQAENARLRQKPAPVTKVTKGATLASSQAEAHAPLAIPPEIRKQLRPNDVRTLEMLVDVTVQRIIDAAQPCIADRRASHLAACVPLCHETLGQPQFRDNTKLQSVHNAHDQPLLSRGEERKAGSAPVVDSESRENVANVG
jgi:hypothetical protein